MTINLPAKDERCQLTRGGGHKRRCRLTTGGGGVMRQPADNERQRQQEAVAPI